MKPPFKCSAAVAALLALAGHAQAALLVGLTSSTEIARIDTNNIGAATRVAITGLPEGDRLVGIDLRPSTNTIYGITLSNRLYTLNEFTGVASFVAHLSSTVAVSGLGYGLDFDPVADYAGGASLRFITSAGGNYAIDANTGVVGNIGNTIATGFSAVAHTQSTPLAGVTPTSTVLYYLSSSRDTVFAAKSDFNTPIMHFVGPLGPDFLNANGFEILGDGSAFVAVNTDSGPSLATGIWGVDLLGGGGWRLGTFNGTLSGLTASAVPEPGTWALWGAGLAAMVALARRRRA